MTDVRRGAVLVMAALLVLAMLDVRGAAAQGVDGEVEVRVAAQRLADGRTEFALQERESDGSWAERRLPRARFFPANADVGRWLSSSPLTVEAEPDSMLTATPEAGVEVRVAAQLLADGRMEFALQEREADGSWAARRLPSARFFPANARVGRWLASSALTVGATAPAPTATPTPTQAPSAACTPEAVAGRVIGSIALVSTSRGSGTAFYIGGSEWVTAEHVVTGATSVRLRNATLDLTARVVGVRADVDLAVLSAGSSASALRWGEPPVTGAAALVLGYGVGQQSLAAGMTQGIVSERYTESGQTYVRTDAPANPGNSGGPLLDRCGNVIGVIQSKVVDEAVEGVAYALAADSVRALLPSVRTGAVGDAPPASVAVTPSTLTITAFCTGNYDASAACRASAASGLDANESWEIWVAGVEDWDNVYFSLDNADGVSEAELTLVGLAPGSHSLAAIEEQAAGWTEWSEPYEFTIRAATAQPSSSASEPVGVIGDIGGGAALIRRLDGSFWIVEYLSGCSYLGFSSASAEIKGFGSPNAELVVRWIGAEQRCPIVGMDSRVERVTASPTGRYGSSAALVSRANGEHWSVRHGSGCLSLTLGTITAYIRSLGTFAGGGSEILIVDPYSQRCTIWESERL